MRILAVCRWGCNHEVRYMFHRWWRQHGDAVFVVANDDSYRQSMRECEDAMTAPFTVIEPWAYPMAPSLDALDALVAWHRPDIVYVGGEPHQDGADIVADRIRKAGLPQVWAVSQNLGASKTNDVEKRAMPLIDGYLCCSQSVADRYVEVERCYGFPPAPKLRSGVGALNDAVFRPYPPQERVALRRATMPEFEGKMLIGFAGRIIKEKGIANVILALATMPPDVKNRIRFLVAGDHRPHQDELRSLMSVHRLDEVVRFVGYQPTRRRLAEWMACLDLFVFPSIVTDYWVEQLGLAPIEAGMVGTPAVVSECGGLRDIVVERETGLFAKPGDVADLREQIMWMLTHERKRQEMGLKASSSYAERYGLKEADRERAFLTEVLRCYQRT